MVSVMKNLGIPIPEYKRDEDPTRNSDMSSCEMDWTIPTSRIKEMKLLYKKVCKPTKRKRKTFMYERDRIDYTKEPAKPKKPMLSAKQDVKQDIKVEPADTSSKQNSSGANRPSPDQTVDKSPHKIEDNDTSSRQETANATVNREIKEEIFEDTDYVSTT